MKKLTFGTPEKCVPTRYCPTFNYVEEEISYPVELIKFEINTRGCLLRLPLGGDEQIYGLGLQLQVFNLRNKKLITRVNSDPMGPTGDSHAPVPFFVSTAGYGVFVDTARNTEFHFGSSKPINAGEKSGENKLFDSTEELYVNRLTGEATIDIQIPFAQGVDIYIMEGSNITDVVSKYNMLAGGGCEAPEWALFPIYRCYLKYTDEKILEIADKFKKENYKIGTIGLEPGWQTRAYSCSFVWDPEKYKNPEEFVKKIRDMGYHLNLWEHCFTHPESPLFNDILPYSGDLAVWNGAIPDFALKEARKVFADYHRKFVEMGVDGFKLDECDNSDYKASWSFPNHTKFPSGMDGEQYHSMFGVLYMQAMDEAMNYAPRLSQVRSAGALSSCYPYVLYSDLYDHEEFIRGCANAGFSGLLWSPELRDATCKEDLIRRLQATTFSVQCLINAWYCEDLPWKSLDCTDEVKALLEEREKLVPMLCEAFKQYKKTGKPPVRALVSDYTDDPETYNIDDQYIMGDNMIVAPIASGKTGRKVYLPAGEWKDYFTGEPVESGWFEVETNGIPVYVKA